MKRSLSMYALSAVGAVVLMLSACGKKEEPDGGRTRAGPGGGTRAGASGAARRPPPRPPRRSGSTANSSRPRCPRTSRWPR